MRAVLLVLVVMCALAAVCGDLVCGSTSCKPNMCTDKPTQASCKAGTQYRANHAGKCACCPACVTLLNEGKSCKTYHKELGETPSAICREPLRCLNGVCTKVAPRN